ncbi:MAG TPA: M20/M25/M40 family metallo-hydrolase [Steroidobacteraceae bacterium]|jgi:acetylornithine deacetylase/succinyl-diaminopimelate desuccinylase-like protein|nr:M20/M25/M40 family metallo-hydrolase [Steroidobacteraceae bacterium]
MNLQLLRQFIEAVWQSSIVERLQAYVRIPNKSPAFDPDWERHGYMDQAIELMAEWCRAQPVPRMRVEVRRLPGITPLLLVDIPGELPECVLLYGHLDKQPEFTGWLPGLGPWEPVIRDGKLYGRGAADDGYAVFSSLTAIAALKAQAIALPRCILMIEATEESGSIHLPAHLDALGPSIGEPSLVVCLDAECGNYGQLWTTTSLRGNLVGKLKVRVLTEGAHSGLASGIAPTPFRLLGQLIARVENPVSGELTLPELHADIPEDRRAQISAAAAVLGAQFLDKIPFAPGVMPVSADPVELLVNNTWRPSLAVTGADGLPPLSAAGNVLLPEISLKVSLRLPPTVEPARAGRAVQEALQRNPPYGAQVSFEPESSSGGWNAPAFAPWFEHSMQRASRQVYGRDAVSLGGGGTIPFLRMLGERFPATQFFVTGVLGPHSNAHGPNEFLHIEYATRLTECVSMVLADFGEHCRSQA